MGYGLILWSICLLEIKFWRNIRKVIEASLRTVSLAALTIFVCYFFYSFGAHQLFDFSAMAFKAPLTSGELWQNWVDVLNILGVLVLAHAHLYAKAVDYERLEQGFGPEW